MAAPARTPATRRRQAVEALVLALGRSGIAATVNIGTLRYYIEFSLKDMLRGRELDLTPLWKVLAAEPGLTREMIAPPLLCVHSWQERLELRVQLPRELDELKPEGVDGHVARLQISDDDLDAVLGTDAVAVRGDHSGVRPGGKGVAALKAAQALTAAGRAGHGSATRDRPRPRPAGRLSPRYLNPGAGVSPGNGAAATEVGVDGPTAVDVSKVAAGGLLQRHRRPILGLTGATLAAALVLIGVQLFGAPGSGVDLTRFAETLNIREARRVGHAVTGVVDDARWGQMDRAARRLALEGIFTGLEADGVRSLILKAPTGETRALISSVGGERTIRIE